MADLQFPTESGAYPEPSRAGTALTLGIIAILIIPVLGPYAWKMANTERQAILEGRRPPTGQTSANVARILGIIATVSLTLTMLLVVLHVAGVIDLRELLRLA